MRRFNKRFQLKRLSLSILAATILFSSTTYAIDANFYSTNNVIFYNPDATSCSNLSVSVNAAGGNDEKIFYFLVSTSFKGYGNKPFGAVQAAGAVGNFFQESGWNFSAVEGNGIGHGIAQWSYGRYTTLQAEATKLGKQWNDPEVQFQMLKDELDGAYGQSLLSAGYDKLTDPVAASLMFEQIYESAGTPNQKNRDNAATKAYQQYANLAPGTITASNCGATATASSDASGASFVTSDGFAVYLQTDPRWASKPYSTSTIGESACGPSSMAMIITALTGKAVNLVDIANAAASKGMYIPSVGSSWIIGPSMAQQYGLKSAAVAKSVTAVNAVLRSGGYVILSGQGAVPFTSSGHFIVIRGITASGQWRIGDSFHKDANETPYDPSYILSIANDNLYAITK